VTSRVAIAMPVGLAMVESIRNAGAANIRLVDRVLAASRGSS
jgi:hypothetical protein